MTVKIAVTCDHETVTDRRGKPSPRYLCPQGYVTALTRAGALALLVPHEGPIEAILDTVDGLVVSGGDFDVPPSYYGEQPRSGLRTLAPERSDAERRLCALALERDMPILGVCGGMQLLNVLRGGTLYQDLAERSGTERHEQAHDKREPAHSVELAPRSLLHEIFDGRDSIRVNSTHHQIIRELGTDVVATGLAPDGVIEAIELTDRTFAVGVQWHPELLSSGEHQALYDTFVATCKTAHPNSPNSGRGI